uniref:Adhesion G-protein coupled receptor F3 n=1 Tax=Castor canadensis TaxID=51338 RepID=A0A8C0XL09_CASCN
MGDDSLPHVMPLPNRTSATLCPTAEAVLMGDHGQGPWDLELVPMLSLKAFHFWQLLVLPPGFLRLLTLFLIVTGCNDNGTDYIHCVCLSGYQWNARLCSQNPSCHPDLQSCDCLIFQHPVPGYCQLLPPVPGNLSLNSPLQMPGNTLNLTLLTSQQATELNWFLKQPRNSRPILLQPGRQVSLTSSQSQAALSIIHMSHDWAGEYLSIFEAQGFRWKLHQLVQVPLQETEVARFPDQLSISCANSSGFQLSCCFPMTNLAYRAAWSPMEDSQVSLYNISDSQCLVLAAQHCPGADTTYTCVLQSQDLAPVKTPITITIIQDGDTTCPEDFSVSAWNVTKAGHVAQAPCPRNKKGMMKRPCGPSGVWGPVQNDCTDRGILTLSTEARVKLLPTSGQGRPDEEVPRILKQLPRQVEAASSPSDLRELLSAVMFLAEVVVEARMQLDHNAMKDLLTTTDKVLDVKISSLWTLAKAQNPPMVSGFLWAVEALVRRLCPWDHPFSFSSSNVLLHSQLFRPTFPGDYQISFSTPPLLQAQIPRHSLASLMHNKTNISITSLVLQKLAHLLPPNYGQGLRGSPYAVPGMVLIMSITSGGQALTNAEIIMDFGDTNGTLHCVFWDHNLFQGEGGWSDEGCQAQATNTTPTTQCICQHLTAFSILMSRHVIPKDPVLKLLSGLGLGASILALLMCLAVYRLVWRVVVRNRVAFLRHTALFNMVICLLIADTSFMGALFLPLQHRSPLCFAITFLWHYFYLATFFWMLAQALVLAHQLLFVFHHLSRHVVLSLMVTIGYLCPLGLVGVSLGVYLPQGLYLREDKCFINGNEAALYTFMGPVLTIVCVNGIVLAIVVLKLLRPSLSEGPPAEEKRQAFLGVLKALLLLTPIFGLTWGLGVATLIEEVSMVPHYVFTILNTLQGVFIFVFGCLADKKVQEALRKHFCHTQSPNSTISLVSAGCKASAFPESTARSREKITGF